LASWSFTDTTVVPDPDSAHARIDLCLFRDAAPGDGRPVAVVLSDFAFTLAR
jgi:hypothetical protein